MEIKGIIEEIPIITTDTKPQKYILTISGVGTMDECNHVMNKLSGDSNMTEWKEDERLSLIFGQFQLVK